MRPDVAAQTPPDISIVTISFNQAEFLGRAMNSVLSQTGAEVEYIVVDPGSTDGSRQIIEDHRDRLSHMLLAPDDGPADGLNQGFALATGRIFGFVNSDDLLLPGALAEVSAYFEQNPGVEMVSGDAWRIDAEDRIERPLIGSPFDPRRYILGGTVVVQQSTFFRAEAFHRVGGFNAANRVNWDTELFLNIALSGPPPAYVPRMWSAFRFHADSITVNQRHQDMRAENARRFAEMALGRQPTGAERALRLLRHQGRWLGNPGGLLRQIGGMARAKLGGWRISEG